MCAHRDLTQAGDSKSTHTDPDNHSGGKREKKIDKPHIRLSLSEFLPLLNDLGTLLALMYYELSFSSLYKDTEFLKSSLKKYSISPVPSAGIFFH